MLHLLLSALVGVALPEPPQQHPLVGHWAITVPTQIRGENGLPTPYSLNGHMAVVQVGDSLVATVTMDAIPGQAPRPEARVAGAKRDGTVHLMATNTATLAGNGELLSRPATTTYVLEAKGDELAGFLELEVAGVPGIPKRAITGKRVTAGGEDIRALGGRS